MWVTQGAVPEVDAKHPLRCRQCFGFVNPYWSFLKNGKEFRCNLCRGISEVPEAFFSPLNTQGLPIDAERRPELCCSVYDFKVDSGYHSRACMGPHYVFVLDLSASSVDSGVPLKALLTVKKLVQDMQLAGGPDAYLSFVLLTEKISLLVFNEEQANFQIVSMNPVQRFQSLPVHPKQLLVKARDFTPAMLDRLEALGSGIGDRAASLPSFFPVLQSLLITSVYVTVTSSQNPQQARRPRGPDPQLAAEPVKNRLAGESRRARLEGPPRLLILLSEKRRVREDRPAAVLESDIAGPIRLRRRHSAAPRGFLRGDPDLHRHVPFLRRHFGPQLRPLFPPAVGLSHQRGAMGLRTQGPGV